MSTNQLAPVDASADVSAVAPAPADLSTLRGWQPIATAPKDTALLLHNGVCYDLGHFNTFLSRWVSNNTRTAELWMDPAHWMPLPEPPAGEAS